EEEEIRCRRVEEDREADEEEEEIVVAVCMLNESRQHYRRRGPNVDRHRQYQGKNLLEDYFIPNSLYHKYDTVGILGLLSEQKRTAALRMLAYGASAERGVRIPMNTALTRIYERPMGPNGQPMKHEPLIQNGQYNNPMIDRYQEMQSSYVHERRQVDLIEHLWEMKGNHSG
ncbi:unnamed protein product, partial [Prunus brigantina]